MDIEQIVREGLKEIDFREIVEEVIRSQIRQDLGKTLSELIRETANSIVKDEIIKSLAEPVTIKDGWSSQKKFDTFEAFFRSEFQKEMKDSYKINRIIEEHVKKNVENLVKNNYVDLVKKFFEVLDAKTNAINVKVDE